MIRLGILGCGRIIKRHIQHLQERPEAEIVALCDVNPEALQTASATYFPDTEIATFTDPATMYSQMSPDGVIIATPHTLHFTHAVEAMEAGCHVFLEKPMVTSSEQAFELKEKAEALGRIVAIGYNTSSKKVFQYLRARIRDESFGKLEMVCGHLSQNWMRNTTGTWRQDPTLSGGGQAYDSGAHILNSLLWSVESQPETVFALTDHKEAPVDINSVMTVRFVNQILANITISGNCAVGGQHMVFIFENGKVEIDGWAGGWIKVQADGFPEEPDIDIPEVFPINNFVDAIRGEAVPAAGIENGINHSLLMDGVYESARTGTPVHPARKAAGMGTAELGKEGV